MANLIQDLLAKIQPDTDEELQARGKRIGGSITDIVGTLRTPELFPNKAINELMVMVWNLFGNQIVPTAAHQSVSTISFALMGAKSDKKRFGIVLLPFNWMDQLKNDPLGCGGGVVYVGSQARDYYNARLYDPEHSTEVQDRAKAYEAEYLNTILGIRKNQGIEYKLSSYQKGILEKFPQGISSDNAKPLIYVSRPFSMEAQA